MKGKQVNVVSDMGAPNTELVGIDVKHPQTPAASSALSVATRFYSPALLNHCFRSYLWAAKYGAAHGIAFDDHLGDLAPTRARNLVKVLQLDSIEYAIPAVRM